jgi:hypothetical protein
MDFVLSEFNINLLVLNHLFSLASDHLYSIESSEFLDVK